MTLLTLRQIHKSILVAAFALSATLLSFNSMANGIIDDFVDPLPHFDDCAVVTSTTTMDSCDTLSVAGTILGGEREIDLTWLDNTFDGTVTVENPFGLDLTNTGGATISVGGGFLTFDNDSGVLSNAVVTYDGIGAGVMSEDISTASAFAIDLFFLDFVGSFDASMTVADNDSSFTLAIPSAPTTAPPAVSILLPYLSFTGIDFTQVTSIVFDVTSSKASVDLGVAAIRYIPEPGTLAIFALGLIGLAATRKNKLKLK